MFPQPTLTDWSVDFESPLYLLLVLLLPLFWFIGRRSLQALGPWRRRAALGLRLLVALLLIVTLAEPNWITLARRLTVLFVVDASDSIQREELARAVEYVDAAAQQRRLERGDRAGVIVFGREADVEIPPVAHPWRLPRLEGYYDPQFTNLESALQLAAVTFPADTAKRVVIVSDGNQNMGQAEGQAQRLLELGVGIDCVPITYERRGEVMLTRVAAPQDIRRGRPFSLRIALENIHTERAVPGRLRITRQLGGRESVVADEPLTLQPGTRVISLQQVLLESGMSTYEARFTPDNPADDASAANNAATAFTRVSGQGHVLVIEDAAEPGRFDRFIQFLRENEIEVTVRDTRWPFDNLADLQQFDCVILADVARVAQDGSAELAQFSDRQIQELVQNTEHFGCGLVMLGGPNSYGAGGWNSTALEEAMPVDFDVDNNKVVAVGALMLVIDSSGSMGGEKIVWSKSAAIAASQMLGSNDYIGVVAFNSGPNWVVPMQPNRFRDRVMAQIDRLGAGGGTNMMPALRQGYQAILQANASVKHVIVLTDGRTPQDDYSSLVSAMNQRGITTTGVAIGPDADRQLLATIGQRGGGKFYHVQSPNAIPRIFMQEARRVVKPLVYEDENGIPAQIVSSGELLAGIDGPVPPITGYVLTTLKEDPLVNLLIASPSQPQPNSAILATRQFGLGRTVALTTDVGQRWATAWQSWSNSEKLLLQTIEWAMRDYEWNDRLAMTAEAENGRIEVVVNALDEQDAHLNLLNLFGTAVLPGGESQDFSLEQIAPGRYVARVPAHEPGNYYLSVAGGGRPALLRTAVHVANTAELERLYSYEGFLNLLAEWTPAGGEPGQLIQSPGGIADTEGLLATDVFREGLAPAESRESAWPLVLLAASMIFLGDVFCRRVLVTFDWLPRMLAWLTALGRPGLADAAEQGMERLRRSKKTATSRYRTARASESQSMASEKRNSLAAAASDAATSDIEAAGAAAVSAAQGEATRTAENRAVQDGDAPSLDTDQPTGYTARLLDAKRRLRDGRP